MKRDGRGALLDFLIRPNKSIGPFCVDMTVFEVLIASKGWSIKKCTYEKDILQLVLVFSKRRKSIEVILDTAPPYKDSSLYVMSVSSRDAVLGDGRSIQELDESEIGSIFNVKAEPDNFWTLSDLKSGVGFLSYSDAEGEIMFIQRMYGASEVSVYSPS